MKSNKNKTSANSNIQIHKAYNQRRSIIALLAYLGCSSFITSLLSILALFCISRFHHVKSLKRIYTKNLKKEQELWNNQNEIKQKLVTYKQQPCEITSYGFTLLFAPELPAAENAARTTLLPLTGCNLGNLNKKKKVRILQRD